MGLVDLHSHLLWDLDDGCRTPAETLEAARALSALGYTDVAASPHAQDRYPGGDAAVVARRLEEARELLARSGVPLRLHRGAESTLDARYLALLLQGQRRGIGESERYALVELPFLELVPDLPDFLGFLVARGVRPILAHPERCAEFERPGRAREAVDLGAVLQLNLGSLGGRHGPVARALAHRLLDAGLYAVAGTDLHGPAAAAEWIGEALEALARRAGREAVGRLCEENPRRALAGEDLA
jgi:protein-tyrosine phosphatase